MDLPDVFPKRNQPRTASLYCRNVLSEHPLAQAIASRAKDLNHKAEAFKASWEKEPLQDVWFVRNGFVGKLEFIRENHEEQEADC
jgi:cation transport ATPase